LTDATGTADAVTTARPGTLVLKVLAAILIGIKIWSLVSVNLVSDEAYYWMWGQHPELSYFDHPPLNAWMIWISSQLFGHGLIQLRMWSVLTTIGTAAIFWNWAKRFGGDEWEPIFWRTLCIWLAAPMFGVYPTLATSDHLLFFFVLLSGHFLISYLLAVRERGTERLRDLYLGALFMGVTALSKYNALFFGLALLFYIIGSPSLRRLLRSPHTYLAALLVVVVASPVLIWNISNGFASFEFHLVERHDASFLHRISADHIIEFFIQTALMATPFGLFGIVAFAFSRPRDGFERTAWGLGSWFFWLSTLGFLVVALTQQLFPWWNFSAYVLMMPFLGKTMKNAVLFWGHIVFGLLLSVFYVYSSSVFPLLNLVDRPDPTRERYYGWNEIGAPIEAAIARYQPDFIASTKWESASVVGFALDNPDVVSISPRPSEYHYWFDKPAREARRGQNALVVVQSGMDKFVADPQFETLTPIEEVPIVRRGKVMTRYQLYWGEGYKPSY
jgi:hypothetical protein